MLSAAPASAPAEANHRQRRPPQDTMHPEPNRHPLLLLTAYVALILYGSLFPFSGWHSGVDTWAFLEPGIAHRPLSLPDLVVNALIYIPIGVLIRLAMARRSLAAAAIAATVLGGLLSLTVETAQAHLPQRVPALSDLLLNTAGALAGALLAGLLAPDGRLAGRFGAWRQQHLQPGPEANIALLATGLWALAQLAPFVPSLDIGLLRSGLKPLAQVLDDPSRFEPVRALTYALEIAALALLIRDARQRPASVTRALWAFFFAVLIGKAFVVSRQVSAEALIGALAGLTLALGSPRALKPRRPALAALMLALALTVGELAPEPGPLRVLNTVPFLAHMSNPMQGLSVLLDSAWPYLALALALYRCSSRSRIASGVIVAGCGGLAFALEWLQQYVPGRTPDLTTAVIALTAAALTVGQLPRRSSAPGPGGLAGTFAAVCVFSAVAGLWSITRTPPAVAATSASKAMLPEPAELRMPDLPGFRTAHPRLPHPDAGERARIAQENPEYINQLLTRARGGQGDLAAAIEAEFLRPGSQDMRALTERLIRLKPSWRGHEQTKPIAQAYDWLHGRIPPDLMPALRDKVIEACEYQISVIRTERLSPYNVYLYNSPLQALMACALAVYRDDPRAEPVMAFTHDYWLNRVLPVWRQIGGRNGGWHEGGEYVGIGIGQAIYQLPAMWRAATGDDLFAREPAIHGFLTFLIHRALPDGTIQRWGDVAFPRRRVDDALALALEFRDRPAYSMLGSPKARLAPTSWPWGPLPDATLYSEPEQLTDRPLIHFADGLGLVTARSGWDRNATIVSFKAGDNYWSHSHLDQGAFTLYTGVPLALDSGCYCGGYGSDHYLNYYYQTIAHNTVTVTDPADNAPKPARKDKEPRPIANDGGQRRVGSGWDLHAAPLDLDDWRRQYDDFHTGRLHTLFDEEGLLVALADITPAYTNSQSGPDSFHHRTRRVEKAWRVFVYDRRSGTIVVYDDIEAARPDLAKRWLLHGTLAPAVSGNRFVFERPLGGNQAGTAKLEGTVLFPSDARLTPIGGRGFEFFADGQNYDENGAIWGEISRHAADFEAGAWRIEVSPALESRQDRFLVVMHTGTDAAVAPQKIERLTPGDGRIGARIEAGGRTLELLFQPDRLAVDLTLRDPSRPELRRSLEARAARAPARSWMQTLREWMHP